MCVRIKRTLKCPNCHFNRFFIDPIMSNQPELARSDHSDQNTFFLKLGCHWAASARTVSARERYTIFDGGCWGIEQHAGKSCQPGSQLLGVDMVVFHAGDDLFQGDDPGGSQDARLAHPTPNCLRMR